VEAPKPIFDLMNFDLLLRGFPSFKIVFFFSSIYTNFEKKKNVINLFFQTGIQDFQDLLDH
jgi:hypothetical protein